MPFLPDIHQASGCPLPGRSCPPSGSGRGRVNPQLFQRRGVHDAMCRKHARLRSDRDSLTASSSARVGCRFSLRNYDHNQSLNPRALRQLPLDEKIPDFLLQLADGRHIVKMHEIDGYERLGGADEAHSRKTFDKPQVRASRVQEHLHSWQPRTPPDAHNRRSRAKRPLFGNQLRRDRHGSPMR